MQRVMAGVGGSCMCHCGVCHDVLACVDGWVLQSSVPYLTTVGYWHYYHSTRIHIVNSLLSLNEASYSGSVTATVFVLVPLGQLTACA